MILLCCLSLAPAAAETEDGDITGECRFLSANKRASLSTLTDDSEKTKLSLNANDWFGLQWSNDLRAQGLYLVWESLPAEYIVEQRDFAGATIATAFFAGGMPQEYIPLDPGCGMVMLVTRGKGVLKGICLCKADTTLPARVHNWRQPAEKADLMLVAAAPGDEFSVFHGVLETYELERSLPCTLVYLTRAGDEPLNAALDALWESGVRSLPIIGSYGAKSSNLITRLEGGETEEEYATAFIAELIRRYQPLVLVSHAGGGEAGDALREETYRAVRQASALAGQADMFPASAEEYGLWKVSKLYLQDDGDAKTDIDGVAYGLFTSAVGEDVAFDDLFENIPETAYAGYTPPEATPTPVITPTPYVAPTPTPAPTEEPDSVKVQRVSTRAWLVLGALLVIILVLVVILAVRVILEWRKTGVPGLRKRKTCPEEEHGPEEAPEPEDVQESEEANRDE